MGLPVVAVSAEGVALWLHLVVENLLKAGCVEGSPLGAVGHQPSHSPPLTGKRLLTNQLGW